MSATISIVFHPQEKRTYYDCCVIEVEGGSGGGGLSTMARLQVPMHANPAPKLIAPDIGPSWGFAAIASNLKPVQKMYRVEQLALSREHAPRDPCWLPTVYWVSFPGLLIFPALFSFYVAMLPETCPPGGFYVLLSIPRRVTTPPRRSVVESMPRLWVCAAKAPTLFALRLNCTPKGFTPLPSVTDIHSRDARVAICDEGIALTHP